MTRSEISKALGELYEAAGQLTAEDVVKAAKPASSPLHGCFEWDNKKAGHQFRLVQARTLIRATKITVSGQAQRLVHVPVEAADAGDRQGHYVAPSVLTSDDDRYNRALSEAEAALRAAEVRVAELMRIRPAEKSRFSAVTEAIHAAKLCLLEPAPPAEA